jgi:hypothetical protein
VSTSISFSVLDNASEAIRVKVAQCQPTRIARAIAEPLAEHWRMHLGQLPRNQHGYPSTGFWRAAEKATRGRAVGDGVLLTCDKLGVRQRLYGGTINGNKYLTIPLCAEAYGHLAGEFDNLVLVVIADGRKFLAQWLGDGKKPNIIIMRGKVSGKARATARVAKHLDLKFMYVLKESVYQPGNPNVIPEDLQKFALKQVEFYVSTPMPKSKAP